MRGISFLSRPTADIIRNIGRIHRQEIRFILEPCGPTKFHLKQIYPITSRSGTIYTVSIGSAQLCTCGSREICVHILYVMMRYFGVPKDSQLLYQRSLSDGEIDSLFERRYIRRARSHNPENRQSSPNRNRSQNNRQSIQYNAPSPQYIPVPQHPCQKVNRLKISEDDLCPICYDSLLDCPPEEVAWCSFGCGGNFHLKCVQEWITSQNADGKPGSCPLCRVQMDGPDTSTAPNQTEFIEFYRKQKLQKQNHQNEEAKNDAAIFHSKDGTETNNQLPQIKPNEGQNESSNNNNNNGGSYLAMLRREMEASSQSRAQIQQQIKNQERSQNNNNDNISLSMSELAAQITEIDEFLTAARAELDNEMNRLKEHQRQVQATIEAQIKAGARARSGLKDSRGRNVEPVLKVRVPIFDSNSASNNNNQQTTVQKNSPKMQRNLPRVASPPSNKLQMTISNQQRSEGGNILNNESKITNTNEQAVQRPTRIVINAVPTAAKRIVRNDVINSCDQNQTHENDDQKNSIQQKSIKPASQKEGQISPLPESNSNTQKTISSLQSPPRSQNSPNIARPNVSPSSSSIFTSQQTTNSQLSSPLSVQPPNSQPPSSSLSMQLPNSQSPSSSLSVQPPNSQPPSSSLSMQLPNSQSPSSPLSVQPPNSQPPSSSLSMQLPNPQLPSSPLSMQPPNPQSPSSLQCSSSLSNLPSSSPLLPPPLKPSSSLSTVPEHSTTFIKSTDSQEDTTSNHPQEKRQSRLCTLIDDLLSLESYEEELPPQPQITLHQPTFTTPNSHSILLNHGQTRQARSSLSVSQASSNADQNDNKKTATMMMKTTKTINLNDAFNDPAAPRGNITDGLTLARQQARENEQRMQRTLNPALIPKGLGAKRAAKSRLQPKRSNNGQLHQQNKKNAKLGWSS